MTQFERAWSRIHAPAKKLAFKTETPNVDQALIIVRKIIKDEQCEQPPPEAMEYFALELRGLIGYYRGDAKRTTPGLTY